MFKYYLYISLSALLINCGGSSGGVYRSPPYTPGGSRAHINQAGQCFLGLMRVDNDSLYATFLDEAPGFRNCGKTDTHSIVNIRTYGGSLSCKSWTAPPSVEITFDLNFKTVQKFQVNPRGSGGLAAGFPIILQANAPILPQNEDRGWNAVIPPANPYSGGSFELYCRNCDFNKDREMSIRLEYRGQRMGEVSINPKATIARCSSAAGAVQTHPSYAYPR